MKLIRELHAIAGETFDRSISLTVERRVLAKRRWRGQAEDRTDFGFDLQAPLRHGICFHAERGQELRNRSKAGRSSGYLTPIKGKPLIGHGR